MTNAPNDARQIGRQILDEAVGKIVLLGVIAQMSKGSTTIDNRGIESMVGLWCRTRGRPCMELDTERPDWTTDVLCGFLTPIDELHRQLATNIVMDRL